MLTIDHVKSLIDRHQKKAAAHIELLKAKKDGGVSVCLREEGVAVYWSHPEVSYLSLNTLDYINYYKEFVRVPGFIDELDKIKSAAPEKLEELYFGSLSREWRIQGVVRSGISKDEASEEFLDRVFKL
ncbi:hypothetical protein [Pseudomonas sp. Au-Pse12]|uniref:hypothetical protein n=1 Tax=Pseudomonas sp. Au-Pse12 TaxID=2906459 RepID=UPI001E4E1138|nr:hypothetical protein [Pseudomonas sp. Au-Pse12]MCE4052416.1 hypothetical protein [Pseudomonas sp. Au-Pse12]